MSKESFAPGATQQVEFAAIAGDITTAGGKYACMCIYIILCDPTVVGSGEKNRLLQLISNLKSQESARASKQDKEITVFPTRTRAT